MHVKVDFEHCVGKVYVDNLVNRLLGKLINVKHRNMVFTILEEIINYFGREGEIKVTSTMCI